MSSPSSVTRKLRNFRSTGMLIGSRSPMYETGMNFSNYSYERLKEEISELRQLLQRNENQIVRIKTDQLRNEEESRKNFKQIDDIMQTSPKQSSLIIGAILSNSEYDKDKIIELSAENIKKLKDMYLKNILKLSNKEVIHKIEQKENQIKVFQDSTKINFMSKLSSSIQLNKAEIKELKNTYNFYKAKFDEASAQLQKIKNEISKLKEEDTAIKQKLDDLEKENIDEMKKSIIYEKMEQKEKRKLQPLSKSRSLENLNKSNSQEGGEGKENPQKQKIEEIRKLEEQIEELKKLNKNSDAKIKQNNEVIINKNKKSENLKKQFSLLQYKYNKKCEGEKSSDLSKREKELKKTLSELEGENERIKKENEKLKMTVNDQELSHCKIEEKINSQNEKNLTTKGELDELQEKNGNLEEMIKKQKDKIQDLNDDIANTQALINQKENSKPVDVNSLFPTGVDVRGNQKITFDGNQNEDEGDEKKEEIKEEESFQNGASEKDEEMKEQKEKEKVSNNLNTPGDANESVQSPRKEENEEEKKADES